MGETGIHVNVMIATLGMLRRYYSGQDRVAILGSMFLYYAEGEPRKVVCPGVFVTLNVPSDTTRRTFKTWIEGKGPDLVIEVTSKKTRHEDLHKKFDLYCDVLKVREYFLFDPLEEYLEPSLQGFRLREGTYAPIPWDGAGIVSEVMGLRLERDAMDLRFIVRATGRRVLNSDELEKAAQAAAEAQAEAAAEIDRLRRENEALRRRLPEGAG
jgi:Uma2 family endonuclease